MDWGYNGADFKTLDFSYVAKGKGGNLHKVYGRVMRNDDNETYDTYDIKAGRHRIVASKQPSVNSAIRAHVKAVVGIDPTGLVTKGKMPVVPESIREPLMTIIKGKAKEWNFFWRGDSKFWTESQKTRAREAFAQKVWDKGDFYCESVASKKAVVPLGILNIDIGDFGNLYNLWRESVENIENVKG